MASTHYDEMREFARETRSVHGVTGVRVLRTDLRRIYGKLGIKIDLWDLSWKVRGAYFDDERGTHVVLARDLPLDPAVFTMAHELKHHLADRKRLAFCVGTQISSEIEIGAEVFAAEFLFPEADFVRMMTDDGVAAGRCTKEHLVRLKHRTGTTMSYAALVKLGERLGFIPRGVMKGVAWRRLEQQVLGLRDFRRRARRLAS